MSQTTCPKCKATVSQLVECQRCGEKWDLVLGTASGHDRELLSAVLDREQQIETLKIKLQRAECHVEWLAEQALTLINTARPLASLAGALKSIAFIDKAEAYIKTVMAASSNPQSAIHNPKSSGGGR